MTSTFIGQRPASMPPPSGMGSGMATAGTLPAAGTAGATSSAAVASPIAPGIGLNTTQNPLGSQLSNLAQSGGLHGGSAALGTAATTAGSGSLGLNAPAAGSSAPAAAGVAGTGPSPASTRTTRPPVQIANIKDLYSELSSAVSEAASGSSNSTSPSSTNGNGSGPISPFRSNLPNVKIIDVWNHNLHTEMARIVNLVDTYKYIAMDTEFPGVVSRPTGTHRTSASYHYKMLKSNVDLLKVIQVGFFFCDENGNYIPDSCCWQFNFSFRAGSDMFAPDSYRLLEEAGIRFQMHEEKGIDIQDFGEQLMMSGVVLNPNVKWITFHAGYDYGYLLKIVTCAPLPDDEEGFFELVSIFFPSLYDVKYMVRSCEDLKGGLQRVASVLGVGRIGPQHQAGSDAILTAATFFKLREQYFDSQIDDYKYQGVIFGLGSTPRPPLPPPNPLPSPTTANSISASAGSAKVK